MGPTNFAPAVLPPSTAALDTCPGARDSLSMTQRNPTKLLATACALAAGLTLLATPSSGTAASAAPITARLSASSTTPALFGRVLLRYTVARASPASISLERRRGFYWRSVTAPAVVRFAAGSGQRRLGLLFPGLTPSAALYQVVLRVGTTTLRLPLVVR